MPSEWRWTGVIEPRDSTQWQFNLPFNYGVSSFREQVEADNSVIYIAETLSVTNLNGTAAIKAIMTARRYAHSLGWVLLDNLYIVGLPES